MSEQFQCCPECERFMVLHETPLTLQTMPPHHTTIWWCGCGHTEPGPTRSETTQPDPLERWEQVNGVANNAR